ncbi:hypothetical protein VTI74DRAFT_10510 [Chaetomium olivicolor]
MVHPLMRSSPSSPAAPVTAGAGEDTDPSRIASRIIPMLDRLHVLVIGPGLGRDPLMQDTCAQVVRAARERGMPMVLDADALQLVQRDPALVRGYGLAVLTPNVMEFGRLTKALGVDKEVQAAKERAGDTAKVEALARALGGVMIVQKGAVDQISDGRVTFTVDLEGGRKRSGGQGDTLTGSIATFLGWRRAYLDGIWEHGRGLKEEELVGLAAFGGSAITRVGFPGCARGEVFRFSLADMSFQECSRLAFAKRGRSLQASDLTDEVHTAFLNLFGEVDDNSNGARL